MWDAARIQSLESDVERLEADNDKLNATVEAMMEMIETLHARLVTAGLIAVDGSPIISEVRQPE